MAKTTLPLAPPVPAIATSPTPRDWQLIVASAGTGKTEKIQALVLARLLDTKLSVDDAIQRMLLVSFSDAAAAELRSRIHGTVAHAVAVLRGQATWRNTLLEEVVAADASLSPDEKLQRLIAVYAAIDGLTVCTIHSLCKQILNTYPIESGIRTGLVIASELHEVEEEAIADAYAELVHQYDSHNLWTAGFKTPGGFSGKASPKPAPPTPRRLFRLARSVIEADLPLAPANKPLLVSGGTLIQDQAAHATIAQWFAHEVRERLTQRKKALGLLSVGDLVLHVDHALSSPGSQLRQKLLNHWNHIILDEAQDTDAAQWRILEAIEPTTFHAVGDPKQTIYSFRGAHYDALPPLQTGGPWKDPDEDSLTTNYRSDKPLLVALNHFFLPGPLPAFKPVGPKHMCRLHRGTFAPAHAASGLYFHIARRPGAEQHLIEHTFEQVAEAILHELNEGLQVSETDDPAAPQVALGPKDIAVLVRSNRVAEEMRKALVARGIPVAAASHASLLDSDELRELAAVFAAIAQPYKIGRVATAAMTRIIGFNNASLNKMVRDRDVSVEWAELVKRLAELRQLLGVNGLAVVLERIFDDPWPSSPESARERILQEPDGEQVMKNLLDVGSLLTSTLWRRYGTEVLPSAIAEWLLKASSRSAARELIDEEEENAHSVAIATDENAVRIMTVHAAKGRQFGSVWLPEAWWMLSSTRIKDSGQAWRMVQGRDIVLEVAPPTARATTDARDSAIDDARAEEARLLYVAATRAKHRTHIIAGCFNPYTNKHYLPIGEFLDAANPLFGASEESRLQKVLETLQADAAGEDGVVVIDTLPACTGSRYAKVDGHPPKEMAPVSVPSAMRLTSFSSLSGFAKTGTVRGDETETADDPSTVANVAFFPRQSDDEDAPDAEAASAAAATPLPISLNDLPSGKHSGDFVHKVLEHVLRFKSAIDEPGLNTIIQAFAASGVLSATSLNPTKLATPLWKAITQPLGDKLGDLSLVALASHGDLATEFPFMLGLASGPKTPAADLYRVFAAHDSGDFAGFADKLRPLSNTDARGLLNGYVDLVWRSADRKRVVVIDYKTNLLQAGGEATLAAYTRDALLRQLASSYYLLQAALYASVIDEWMQMTCGAEWDYEAHFHGVVFPFLRAMGPHSKDELNNGVYHVSVPMTLARGLADALGLGSRRNMPDGEGS